MKIRHFAFLMILPLCAMPAFAQSQRVISFRGGPKISVTVPMGYSFDSRANADGSVTVVMSNPIWNIDVQAVMAVEPDPSVTSPEWQQNKVISFMANAMSRANETDYDFRALSPARGTGLYCVFSALGSDGTEATEVGSFTHCTVGLKSWQRFVVIFQILSNGTTSPEYQEMFETFNWSFTP